MYTSGLAKLAEKKKIPSAPVPKRAFLTRTQGQIRASPGECAYPSGRCSWDKKRCTISLNIKIITLAPDVIPNTLYTHPYTVGHSTSTSLTPFRTGRHTRTLTPSDTPTSTSLSPFRTGRHTRTVGHSYLHLHLHLLTLHFSPAC